MDGNENKKEAFLLFETEENLFRRELLGFKYWQYLRGALFLHIFLSEAFHVKVEKKSDKFLKRISLLKYFSRSILLQKKQSDILFCRSGRYFHEDNQYIDIYTDSLTKEFKNNSTVLDLLSIKSSTVFEQDLQLKNYSDLWTLTKIMSVLKLERKNYLLIVKEMKWLVEKLKQSLDITLDITTASDLFYSIYIHRKYGMKYYHKVLKKISPKVIVEVYSGALNIMVLNETAKKLGIPIVELQHGLMADGHFHYNYVEKIEIETYPNKFFAFSKFWIRDTRFPLSPENIIVTGSPYVDEKIKSKAIQADLQKSVLFISQPTESESLSNLAVDLYEIFKRKGDHHKIIYKLHPCEDINHKTFNRLRENSNNIVIITSQKTTVYDCFYESFVQIGHSSTALYEGIAFNLKTLILKNDDSLKMSSLVEHNYAKFICNAGDIIDSLDSSFATTNNFWKKDALSNIKRELNKLLEE